VDPAAARLALERRGALRVDWELLRKKETGPQIFGMFFWWIAPFTFQVLTTVDRPLWVGL
jgi:hypothetical protein